MPPVICRVKICHILPDGMAPYVFHSQRALYGFKIVIACRGKWQNVWISQKLFSRPSVLVGGEATWSCRERVWWVKMSSVWQAKIFLDAPFLCNVFSPLPPLAISIQQRGESLGENLQSSLIRMMTDKGFSSLDVLKIMGNVSDSSELFESTPWCMRTESDYCGDS